MLYTHVSDDIPTQPQQLVLAGGWMTDVKEESNRQFLIMDESNGIGERGIWKELTQLPNDFKPKLPSICQTPDGFVVLEDMCYQYVINSNTWKRLADINADRKRSSAGSVSIERKVYLVGPGLDDAEPSCFCDYLQLQNSESEMLPEEKEWRVLPDLEHMVVRPVLVALAGKIYIVSRKHDPEKVASLHCFNPDTLSWSTSDIPVTRPSALDGISVVAALGKLYMVGGQEKTCMSYCPQTNAWSTFSAPCLNHCCGSAAFFKNTILLMGGSDGNQLSASVEEYSMIGDQWRESHLSERHQQEKEAMESLLKTKNKLEVESMMADLNAQLDLEMQRCQDEESEIQIKRVYRDKKYDSAKALEEKQDDDDRECKRDQLKQQKEDRIKQAKMWDSKIPNLPNALIGHHCLSINSSNW
jgi:hypothetical protein